MGWSFHLKHFVQGKGMARYFDGNTTVEPQEEKDEAIWSQNNSKVVTWIFDTSGSMSLHSFSKASEM